SGFCIVPKIVSADIDIVRSHAWRLRGVVGTNLPLLEKGKGLYREHRMNWC
ncbi:hypothetical protein TorRG33x02_357510, partial [Trema orientale]